MWVRFLVFCILVTLVLFVVLSCIYGRPVVHLFFHRCCGEDIENDQVLFENFGKNFLRERLVATEENTSLLSSEDIDQDIIDSTTKIYFKDFVALRKNSSAEHLVYKDVAERENITLLSIEDVDRVKNDFGQDKVKNDFEQDRGKNDFEQDRVKNFLSEALLVKDVTEVENVTLFSIKLVDKEFKNNHTTESSVGKESIEVEDQFSFYDVGKAIDDMKRLINVHNPSTRDAYDELEADLITEDDALEVTTERLRKRN